MNGVAAKSEKDGDRGSHNDVRVVLDCIRQIVRLLRVSSREAERELGLTGAQLFVLQKLSEAKVLSVNELAERTHTHQSSVSVVAQALVDRGLISRNRASDDARRLELTLTPAARQMVKKAPGAAQDRLIEAIEKMPAALRKQLAKGLERLVEESGIDDEVAPMMFEDGEKPTKASRSKKSR